MAILRDAHRPRLQPLQARHRPAAAGTAHAGDAPGRPCRPTAAYLDHHPQETALLLQDMLISVTNFFRDREAFEALERDGGRPSCFEGRPPAEPGARLGGGLRDRRGGLFGGHAAARPRWDAAVQARRPGLRHRHRRARTRRRRVPASTPDSIATDVPTGRLRQFFDTEPGAYRVARGPARAGAVRSAQHAARSAVFAAST